ncbi:unnamed protein product [Paramecium octaurelia]|uniref:2-(3-amino-3-carboxypropyl)histidine synthase subunit 1 n=1 Tax=Paramecium octaurelia TaxID=43137 RepID=A0A8S1RZS0_PAROT|nr:unnamed protein product [Paramecium octaurelia]
MIQNVQNKPKLLNQIPEYILNNSALNNAISQLPKHYNFEIHKTISRIIETQERLQRQNILINLQFPEGLLLYSCMISDILTTFTGCETFISGDVTYGACCIDDLTADEMQADYIIHYGHSCLVPINECAVKTLYVFVEINIDTKHLFETIKKNFTDKNIKYYLMGTIQFNTYIHLLKKQLEEDGYKIVIPQEKPRSSGEVLGCTSPKLEVSQDSRNIVIFVCDGRFHMESTMIQNPQFEFFQYDPYTYRLTIEKYDNPKMMNLRYQQIVNCQKMQPQLVCIIMSTLGRQGSTQILQRIEELLRKHQIQYFTLLISEINFEQLNQLNEVDFFIQIACPRLSIDWGVQFVKPLLTPYETYVMLGEVEWKQIYPMDYYSNNGGAWTNYYHKQKVKLNYE